MAEHNKPKQLTEVRHPPALQLPPSGATPLRTPVHPHQHHVVATEGVSGGGGSRFRKVGWAKKMGVTLKNPLQPGVPLTPQEVRAIVGLDPLTASSTYTTTIPPLLTMSQCHVTTNAKTRFLILMEHRLQYGSTSSYEAYKQGGCSAVAKEVLGELFMTGEAWVRPVDAMSLLVCGDPVMMKKTGKLYLLVFRSMDERVEWEMAFQFFLCRTVPTERLERLLLSGWMSVFPALGNKVDRVLARRMSIVVRQPQQGPRLPPKRDMGGSSGSILSAKEGAGSPPRGNVPHHEEEEDDTVFGEVVSEGEDDEEASGSSEDDGGAASETDEGREPLQRKKSVMSEAFSSFMYSKRHRHVVDTKGEDGDEGGLSQRSDGGGRRGSMGDGRSSNDGDDGMLSSCSALAKFSLDEVNANGLHFVLRCQRPTIAVGGVLRRPQPMYLTIQWQRASYTIHAVPVLRETPMVERAARFALRSFAEGGPTQASPPRIVLVENPTWQLYTRPVLGATTVDDVVGSGVSGKSWASDARETELVLRPVFPITTLPSPAVVGAPPLGSGVGDEANRQHHQDTAPPTSPRQSRQDVSVAISNDPPAAARAFRAIAWEGTRCNPAPPQQRDDDDARCNVASYSFLVQASHPQLQPRSGGTTVGRIVALSAGGKVFMIPEDHPDATPADGAVGAFALDETIAVAPRFAEAGMQSSFVPLEIVPTVSDAEQTYLMNHQTPAMRERALYRAANKTLSLNFLQQGLMEPIRIALVGASGSGKSTVAQWIRRHSLQGHRHESGRGAPPPPPPPAHASQIDDADADNTLLLGDLAKAISSINCNGIAIPVVVTDIPSSANGALIRTQCSAADIVVCVFDASDEHSLQWLEANLKAVCSGANSNNATTTTAGGSLGCRLPSVRYVLCGTRVDSLRVAVDSYRLEAFRQATVPYTGRTEDAWRRSIGGDTHGTSHSHLAASFASTTTASDDPGASSVPPFSFFASVWRQWRLATATRVSANSMSKTMQAMMLQESFSESFLFSPNLRRIAATGAALPNGNDPGGDNDPLASTNSYRQRAEEGVEGTATGGNSPDGAPSFTADEDDADDWRVPKSLMTQLGSVLEEIYLCRLGKCLGWSDGMVARFAIASCEAAAALQDEAIEGDGHRHHRGRAADDTPRPLPMRDAPHPPEQKVPHAEVADTAPRCGVTKLLAALKLPSTFYFDAVREILHLPRGAAVGSVDRASKMRTPQVATAATSTPQAQRLSSFANRLLSASSTFMRGNGGVRGGIGPTTPAAFVLMNSSIAAIGATTPGGDDGPPLSPSWVAAAMTSNSNNAAASGTPTPLTRRRTVMFPESPSMLLDPQSPQSTLLMDSTPFLLGDSNMSALTKTQSGRLSLAGVQPTWKDVVSCGVRQWDVHWLVFRWICTGMAYGDPRTELILAALRGEICVPLPRAGASSRGGGVGGRGGRQQQRRVFMGFVGTMEDAPVAGDPDASSSTGDRTTGSSSSLDDRRSNKGSTISDGARRRDGNEPFRVDVEDGTASGVGTKANMSLLSRDDRRHNYLISGASGATRAFHPLDLMYVAQGFQLPDDPPPLFIPHATLWVCQQPHRAWSESTKGSGSPTTAGPRHVSPQQLEALFALAGIEVTREHAGLLLRWADTNQDRLTDATDFLRWFVDLTTLEATRRTAPGNRHAGGGGGPATGFPGHFLAMLAADWTLCVLRMVPMLESVAAALRSGLVGDRAWAVAAYAVSLRLTTSEFATLLSDWKHHRSTQQPLTIAGEGGTEWDTADDGLVESTSPGGAGPSGRLGMGGGSKRSGAASSSFLGRIAAVLGLDGASGSAGAATGASSPIDDNACTRCRTVFRAFIRPAIACQECRRRFCERCCKSIVVLNELNRTEKRKLCVTCRRSHSTFMDDLDVPADRGVAGASASGGPSSPSEDIDRGRRRGSPPSSTSGRSSPRTAQMKSSTHRDRGSHNALDALGSAASATGGGGGVATPATPSAAAVVLWEDNAQSSCSICAATFTVLRRRHHCRNCGALVCAACSPFESMVRGFSVPQRVCTSCRHTRDTLRADQSGGSFRPHHEDSHDGGTEGDDARTDNAAALRGNLDLQSASGDEHGRSRGNSEKRVPSLRGDDSATMHSSANVVASRAREGSRFSAHTQGGGAAVLNHRLLGSVLLSSSSSASPAEIELRRSRKRQRWKAAFKDGVDMRFELEWFEAHSPHDEHELLVAARRALEDQLKTIAFLRGKPGGKAAIEAERGPLWAYSVFQPGYTAHDAALEAAYDASTMDALGPDVGPH